MPYTRLDNFGAGGGNYDVFETGLPAQQWSKLTNCDINNGDLESAGADIARGDPCPITPAYPFLYQVGDESYDIISNGDEIYAGEAATGWFQIGTALGGGAVNYDVFRGCLIVNSQTSAPWYWCPLGGPVPLSWDNWHTGEWSDLPYSSWEAVEVESGVETGLRQLPGWPADGRAVQVVAYKDQLVAVGAYAPDIDDTAEGYLVRWSSLAAPGGIPNSWTPVVGNFAGYAYVQDTPGQLAAGKLLRNDLILYKTDSIWRLTATGDPSLPMVLERVLTCRGVESPAAVSSCEEMHFLVGDRGFGLFDGNVYKQLDFLKVQNAISETVAQGLFEFVQSAYYGARQEVWLGYKIPQDTGDRARVLTWETWAPQQSWSDLTFGAWNDAFDIIPATGDELALILKYNIQHDSFTLHYYTDAPDPVLSFVPGRTAQDVSGARTWDNWADGATWATLPYQSWVTTIPRDTAVVMVLAFRNQLATYRHDVRPTYIGGAPKLATLERYGLRFDPERTCTVRSLYPEGAYESMTFELGTSWNPGQEKAGTTQWQPNREFQPGESRRIPLRVVGDTFAVRVQSENRWRLHAVGVEYRSEARR
jgi:hypothetical protein